MTVPFLSQMLTDPGRTGDSASKAMPSADQSEATLTPEGHSFHDLMTNEPHETSVDGQKPEIQVSDADALRESDESDSKLPSVAVTTVEPLTEDSPKLVQPEPQETTQFSRSSELVIPDLPKPKGEAPAEQVDGASSQYKLRPPNWMSENGFLPPGQDTLSIAAQRGPEPGQTAKLEALPQEARANAAPSSRIAMSYAGPKMPDVPHSSPEANVLNSAPSESDQPDNTTQAVDHVRKADFVRRGGTAIDVHATANMPKGPKPSRFETVPGIAVAKPDRTEASVYVEDRLADSRANPLPPVVGSPTLAPPQPTSAYWIPPAGGAIKLQATDEKTQLKLDGELESVKLDGVSGPGTTTSQPLQTTASVSRLELPRSVAAQLSEFARAMPDKPVEVSLNPSELGRVRLSVSASESGVVLNILAERPETLDLMRRHAELLTRELADLGFASIDLAFGQGQSSEQSDDDSAKDGRGSSMGSGAHDEEVEQTIAGTAPSLTISSGGLDIRV